MQEPTVRAEYQLHVRQMLDAGRVPLGFTHFVFNSLRNQGVDQRDDPREREVTKDPRPGDSDRPDLNPWYRNRPLLVQPDGAAPQP